MAAVEPTRVEVRDLPRNLEAEQQVLGSIIIDPESCIPIAAEQLDPAHFYQRRHRVIYQAMLKLFERGQMPEVVVLADYLEEMGEMERAGGRMYVNELVDCVSTTASIEYYTRIVRKHATRRRIIDAGGRIVERGYDTEEEPEAVFDSCVDLLMEVGAGVGEGKIMHISDLSEEFLKWIGHLRSSETSGVGTGYVDLDRLTEDVRGATVICAGATSMGKTAFMLNSAWRLARAGERVGFLTLEMTYRQLMKRFVQLVGRIPVSQLRYTSDVEIRAAMMEVLSKMLFLCEFSENTLWSILRQCRELVMRHHVQAIYVDYIQEMEIPGYHEKRYRELGAIMRALRRFALKYNVAMFVGCQINRDPSKDGGRPKLHQLRESGDIENSTDIALGLYRASYYDRSLKSDSEAMEVIVMKNRNGEVGTVHTTFHGKEQRIEGASMRAKEDERSGEDHQGAH